ncbi:arginine--tRNA ligase [soil metagenome]
MKEYLAREFARALTKIAPEAPEAAVELESPRDPSHGDVATNVAMQLARPLRMPPRKIAELLVSALELDPQRVASVEVAGPGFINIRYAESYLAAALGEILQAGDTFGRTPQTGKTAIVEYVSANPTGPLTVGHGRNAVLGDTFANLLDWTGWKVTREYYFNNAGRQMRILGQSVRARVEELVNPEIPRKKMDLGAGEVADVPETFPEDGYVGEYIIDIARAVLREHGAGALDLDENAFTRAAEKAIFSDIESTMQRLDIRMDSYFNENTLYENDAVWEVVRRLKERGLAYDKDGAVWFKTSELGKTQTTAEGEQGIDTVLVKSSGEPTYRLPDIAYHVDKLSRGYDLVLDVFGADHIATYPDVLRGVEALGEDTSRVEVIIYQFVTLVRGGEPFKMSTRKARYVTLDDLMDEVGEDVARFFFLMRSPNTHLEFDLDLAKEAGEKNPVFYLQYAHARICSILTKAGETGVIKGEDLSLLTHESEQGLIKTLLAFPETLQQSAEARAPHRLAGYLRDVSTAFSAFYRDCRIVGEPKEIAAARLSLADATRVTLRNGFAVLGVSAPERM